MDDQWIKRNLIHGPSNWKMLDNEKKENWQREWKRQEDEAHTTNGWIDRSIGLFQLLEFKQSAIDR